jgi:hypothetical protein
MENLEAFVMGTFFLMVVRLFITYLKYSSLELDIKLSSHSDARRLILTNIANKRVLCKSLQKQKTIALKSFKATAASVFQVWAAGCESESGLCGASFSPRSTATGKIFKCTIHMLVAYGSECNRMSHQPFFSESLSSRQKVLLSLSRGTPCKKPPFCQTN